MVVSDGIEGSLLGAVEDQPVVTMAAVKTRLPTSAVSGTSPAVSTPMRISSSNAGIDRPKVRYPPYRGERCR